MNTTKVLISGPKGYRYVEAETKCPAGSYQPFGVNVRVTEKDTPAWAIYLCGQVAAAYKKTGVGLEWKKARGKTVRRWARDESGRRITDTKGKAKLVEERWERPSSSGCCTFGGHIQINWGSDLADCFYVLLHELAHAMDPFKGGRTQKDWHGPSFWTILHRLAEVYGLPHYAAHRDGNYYQGGSYTNYSAAPERYLPEVNRLREHGLADAKDRMRRASKILGTVCETSKKK